MIKSVLAVAYALNLARIKSEAEDLTELSMCFGLQQSMYDFSEAQKHFTSSSGRWA